MALKIIEGELDASYLTTGEAIQTVKEVLRQHDEDIEKALVATDCYDTDDIQQFRDACRILTTAGNDLEELD